MHTLACPIRNLLGMGHYSLFAELENPIDTCVYFGPPVTWSEIFCICSSVKDTLCESGNLKNILSYYFC